MPADPSIFLFTGENTYLIRQEKRRWQEQFAAKYGSENISRLFGHKLPFREFLDEIAVAPFIAEKRLIVVDGIPAFDKEDMQSVSEHLHPATVLLFVDASPDKRLGGVKALYALATVKECKPLTPSALEQWMNRYASEHGATLTHEAAVLLLSRVGNEQDMLEQELEKLALYAQQQQVLPAHVELLSVPSGEQEVWHLSNLLASGKTKEALLYARLLQERGEDAFSLWNILLWLLRSLVSVWMAAEAGERNPAKIASSYKVPFPTAKSLLPLATRLSGRDLRSFLRWATDVDIALKSGGYRATADAPQELQAMIDRFILHSSPVS